MATPAIYQSEEQMVAIFESIEDGLFIADKDMVVTYANKAFERHAGMKRKNVIGKSLWQSFPHSAYPGSPYKLHYESVISTGKPAKFVHFNSHKSWVELRAYPTDTGGIAVFIRDFTDEVNAKDALAESESRFRALMSTTSDVIFCANMDFSKIRRYDGKKFDSKKSITTVGWIEKQHVSKEDRAKVRAVIANAVANKDVLRMEHPINKNNKVLWYYVRAVPILDENGDIIEWFGVATDITERRKQSAIQERMSLVTEQRNALIKLNKAKDEFVALASHQLRTPATAVKQYVGMLLDGFAGRLDTNQHKLLQSAYDANERELELINDLLKTAQIDGTSHNFKAEPSNIVTILKEAINEHRSSLDHRNQRAHLKHSRSNVILPIDATEIKLAFSNLIENASKYSHPGSDITVQLKIYKKFVDISVADQGVGVSKEHQQQIFEKFTRIRNELTDIVHGTGLGLYWVKKIAEMHGGTVTITSEPGSGSTFTVRLPRQQPIT